jgi:hypothetical protein
MESPLGPGRDESTEMTLATITLSDGSRREFEMTVDEAARLRDSGTIPSERSHLSGAKITKDERESIVVTFGNGTKRRLVIGAEEAAELRGKGQALRSGLLGVFSWLYLVPKSIRIALATLFVGALLTPAISRQFTDRQQESELKSRVAGQIITSSVSATEIPANLVLHNTADLYTADEYCELFQIDKKQESKTQCESAESKAERTALLALLASQSRWIKDYHLIRNELATFSNPKLRQDWADYHNAVFNLSLVTPGACGSQRDRDVQKLQEYLNSINPSQYNKVTQNLGGASKRCTEKRGEIHRAYPKGDSAFLNTYLTIHDRLVDRANEIADTIRRDRTSRYSVGFRDFVRDVFTPLGSD